MPWMRTIWPCCQEVPKSSLRSSQPRQQSTQQIVEPCETCGKKSHTTQDCYSGANWANRPQWWKTPKTTSSNNILTPPQPQGQYVKENSQVAQPQYHNQSNRPNGLSTPYPNESSTPRSNPSKKLVLPHLQFGETVETRHFTTSQPPNTYDHEELNER